MVPNDQCRAVGTASCGLATAARLRRRVGDRPKRLSGMLRSAEPSLSPRRCRSGRLKRRRPALFVQSKACTRCICNMRPNRHSAPSGSPAARAARYAEAPPKAVVAYSSLRECRIRTSLLHKTCGPPTPVHPLPHASEASDRRHRSGSPDYASAQSATRRKGLPVACACGRRARSGPTAPGRQKRVREA
jgi:hypothetical protein